jgi:hypothetical protein
VDGSKRKGSALTVTIDFEPTRLEEENLGAAYEFILPINERVSRPQKIQTRKTAVHIEQQLGIFSLTASS